MWVLTDSGRKYYSEITRLKIESRVIILKILLK